jgi:hypothetical protein
LNIIRYTVNIINLDQKKLLDPWKWLIGEDKEIMVVTKIADAVLKDPDNKLYLLSTADGTMEFLSNYCDDFYKNRLSAEQYYEIFQPTFVEDLEDAEQGNKRLKEGQVYAYNILPILGGSHKLENMCCVDIYEHFASTAATHKEIDELPKKYKE